MQVTFQRKYVWLYVQAIPQETGQNNSNCNYFSTASSLSWMMVILVFNLKKKNLAYQMKHRFICFMSVRIHIPCVLFHCVGCIFLFDYCFLGNLLQKKRRIIYLWIFYYFCNIQCIRCKIEIFILCNWNWYGIFSISNNLSLLNLLYVRNKKMTAEFNGIFYIWR